MMRTANLSAAVLCVMLIGVSGCARRPTERVSPGPEINPNAVVWRTPEPPKHPQAGDLWVNPKDGMEMVYVAPGEFLLGISDAQLDDWSKEHPERHEARKLEWFEVERPQCRVRLEGYWIGRTEVTNAQYERFVEATGHQVPDYWPGTIFPHVPGHNLPDFPVVGVGWGDGDEYCKWALGPRGRLPTELEWEKAARGPDGRLFPWGNEWDPERCRSFEAISGRSYSGADVEDFEYLKALREFRESEDGCLIGPAAVGSYPAGASPYGCLDMAGNVWEITNDLYDWKVYQRYAKGDLKPPMIGTGGTGPGTVRRGGSWHLIEPWYFWCANRIIDPWGPREYTQGFRCVLDLRETEAGD